MKKIYFVLAASLFLLQLDAQTPLNTFNKRTLYKYWDPEATPTTLQQTTDRGYISCRSAYDSVGGSAVGYFDLVKRDREGNTSWIKRVSLGQCNCPAMMTPGLDAIQTNDQGYAGTYMARVDSTFGQTVLFKTDSSLNVLWAKKYPGVFSGAPMQVRQTSDNGFVLGGFTQDTNGAKHAYIFKTDASGNYSWGQMCRVANDTDACFYAVTELPGHGYIACGYSGARALIVSFNNQGSVKWKKSFFYQGGFFAGLTKTSDGQIMAGGGYADSTIGGYKRMCLLKMDTAGNTTWLKGYNANPTPYFGSNFAALVPVSNAVYYSGYMSDPIPGTLLGKIDLNGNPIWSQKYISTFHTFNYEPMPLITTTDGGLALDEFVGTFLNGNANFSKELLKVDGFGDGACDGTPFTLSLGTIGFLPSNNVTVAPCGSAQAYTVSLISGTWVDSTVCETINDHAPTNGIATNSHSNFKLGQNYPNPFSGETSIEYTLSSEAAEVRFEIYDGVGSCVVSKKEKGEPGKHDIKVSGLAPGLYCYSLIVDGARFTRKMLVE